MFEASLRDLGIPQAQGCQMITDIVALIREKFRVVYFMIPDVF